MESVTDLQAALTQVEISDGVESEIGDSTQFGCVHYRRRCKIRAPCCDEVFDCRHCHNDAKNALGIDPSLWHDVPRHEVTKVICSLCGTEQDVQQNCVKCGECMGNYFCEKCKFFDDDVSKKQYHCDQCGICRVGGEENFFHCDKCGCCYSKNLDGDHKCMDNAMHRNCPICSEFLFDSLKGLAFLLCGHSIHVDCLVEMERHYRFSCPICLKSTCDMSEVWRRLDQEVEATVMPVQYRDKKVWILCNDCNEKGEVQFHVVGLKCLQCQSYNTRQIKGGPSSSCS